MTEWTAKDSIVVLGAGIIGLDVALVLVQKGLGPLVTVVAEYLPGDTAPSYTSPWAGCNYSAISGGDANAIRWDRLGYAHMRRLAETCPAEAFVRKRPSTEVWDEGVPAQEKIDTMASYLEDFSILPPDKLPPGATFGIAFTTVTVHAPQHLLYLRRRLEAAGVSFVRRAVPDLPAAVLTPGATRVLFNCIGNAARTFPGVADAACYPTRGQVLLARAPAQQRNAMRYGRGYITYVIPRPGTDGHVILGGYLQKGNGDSATYAAEVDDILARTTALCPELLAPVSTSGTTSSGPGPEILGVVAGLRPSREGGARVERGTPVAAGPAGTPAVALVHNYGAGGTGYQAGYGMATDAVAAVADLLPTPRFVASL